MTVNRLILGDNLEILKSMENDSVDLVYLDPPFFSNRDYEVIWGDTGEIRSFKDRWSGGMDHYIAWLKERVVEMHRILKPSGSIFLHCDWHADAYIRVHILDRIFGEDNFRNDITWKRAHSVKGNFKQGKKSLDYNTDTIYYYCKSKNSNFTQPFKPYSKEYISDFYKHTEPDGRRYGLVSMIGPGGASKGNPKYEFLGVTKYWRFSEKKMKEMFEQGIIVQTKAGNVPLKKQYLEEAKGVAVQNLWDDIVALFASSNERIGYPTQKPEALLERIINMASNEGDIVLDPFMGGGTTIAVADRLNRKWVGIDQSPMAVKVTEFRLQKQTGLFTAPYTVQLYKYDYDTLHNKDAFEFESWIIQQFGGMANIKQRGDFGLDGKMGDNTPIQVKRSDNIGRNVIDNFKSAVERYDKNLFSNNVKANKPTGYIIAFSFSRGAVQEVARLKNEENIIIKLEKVEDIVPIAVKPVIGVHINELEKDDKGNRKIEFIAQGQSPAGIEFYSWDFAYNKDKGFKPSVIIDKEGKQTLTLKTVTHIIAVKVVDNDGLENIEIIKLKINGEIKRE
jgi:DNA modification methylase